jgi:hypothetical protein
MEKKVEYQVSYEIVSTIQYLSEEDPGEHYFSIVRDWSEGLWDSEDDEAVATVENGVLVGVESYARPLSDEETRAIRDMMGEILAK